jgi:hypothetical protein
MSIADQFQYSIREMLSETTGSYLGIQSRRSLRLFVKPSPSQSQMCLEALMVFETFF